MVTQPEIHKKSELKEKPVGGLAKVLANRILFAVHLFVYLAVSGLLVLIWALTIGMEGGVFWPLFEILGWGYGIGLHAITFLIYNDKIEALAKIRRDSTFKVLFVYHFFLYALTSTLVLATNLMTTPEMIYFPWVALMWGIAVGFHAAGFLTWNKMLNNEVSKISLEFPDYETKRVDSLARAKIANLWVLLGHITYFIVANILIYTLNPSIGVNNMSNLLYGTFGWATFLGIHAFGYFLYFFVTKLGAPLKGWLIHIAFYVAAITWSLINNSINESIQPLQYILYPIIVWALIIAVHGFVVGRYAQIKELATKVVRKKYSELSGYELKKKTRTLIFWQWSLIAHVIAYVAGISIIAIDFGINNIETILIIHPIFGWLIGLSFHSACFLIILQKIQGFLKWTATLHLSVYIPTGVYLVVLNVLFAPQFPWSAITLASWGIGLGLHILLAKLL